MSQNDKFDLQNFLPYLLNLAAEASSLEFQRYYKRNYGMLRTEWRVMFHLGRYGEMTAKEICERARLHKTKVSRSVAALEKKRYLKRSTNETDRRQEDLDLSVAGRQVFEDLLSAAARYDAQLSDNLTPQENVFLRDCLRKIAKL